MREFLGLGSKAAVKRHTGLAAQTRGAEERAASRQPPDLIALCQTTTATEHSDLSAPGRGGDHATSTTRSTAELCRPVTRPCAATTPWHQFRDLRFARPRCLAISAQGLTTPAHGSYGLPHPTAKKSARRPDRATPNSALRGVDTIDVSKGCAPLARSVPAKIRGRHKLTRWASTSNLRDPVRYWG
jgi:hypothetical protein